MADQVPNVRLPEGVDEADVLACVEGEPLARDRRARLDAALARDPGLARWVEEMRRDCQALRRLDENLTVPPDLLDAVAPAVEAVLERQMLLGLRDGEPEGATLPISIVMPVPTARRQAVVRRIVRAGAVAAGLALFAGAAMYVGGVVMGGRGPGTRPVASAWRATDASSESSPGDAGEARGAARQPMALPLGSDVEVSPAGSVEGLRLAATVSAEPGGEGEFVGPPLPEPMSATRASELARERRLVVRVRVPDWRAPVVAERLRRGGASGWQAGPVPAALASAVAPAYPDGAAARSASGRSSSAETMWAGRGAVPAPHDVVGPPPPGMDWSAILPPPALPRVFLVHVRADAEALESLRRSLSVAGAEVIFEESSTPLPGTDSPVLHPTAILWWGQPTWADWAAVPVIIQR